MGDTNNRPVLAGVAGLRFEQGGVPTPVAVVLLLVRRPVPLTVGGKQKETVDRFIRFAFTQEELEGILGDCEDGYGVLQSPDLRDIRSALPRTNMHPEDAVGFGMPRIVWWKTAKPKNLMSFLLGLLR